MAEETKTLYELLSMPITAEKAIQRSEKEKTKKGYDTTGYGYQFLVNRFNEVLGIGGWDWSFKELGRVEGKYNSGQPAYNITGEAIITIFANEKFGLDGDISHSEFGGHTSSSITDALKGASTNSFKKTAAFFGVGKDAFEGTIDEDNQDSKEGDMKAPKAEQNKSKKTLEQTLLMVDAISTIETLDNWEKQLETTPVWTDVQKRVIKGRLDSKRVQLKK